MAVDTVTGQKLSNDEEGILCFASPTISDGYYQDPASSEKVFFCDKEGTRWFKTDTIGSVHGNDDWQG